MIRREITLFMCAVQFLTRLPVPSRADFTPDWLGRSARYFPLVGQLIGSFAGMVLILVARVWTGWLPAALAVGVGVFVTGALHEDGLADAADGLGGGRDRERRLAIMKDSRIGTFGVLALVFAVACKVGALANVPPRLGALLLVAAYGGGRLMAVIAMHVLPYAGDPQAAKVRPPLVLGKAGFAFAIFTALWPLALMDGRAALAGVAAGGGLAGLMALAAKRLIGGQTGDILGAVDQLFEVGFVLGASAVIGMIPPG